MVPLRDHINVATPALVLVVPVVAGVTVGGFVAGLVATGACFLIYDFVFLPPYYTLYVDRAEDWVALGVYVVVMVLVSRVVAAANLAKAESELRAAEIRRLFDLSEMLVRELPAPKLLDTIVSSVKSGFNLEGVSLLLPGADGGWKWWLRRGRLFRAGHPTAFGPRRGPGPPGPGRRPSGQLPDRRPRGHRPSHRPAGRQGLGRVQGRAGAVAGLCQPPCPRSGDGRDCVRRRSGRACWRKSIRCAVPSWGRFPMTCVLPWPP